MHALWCLSDDLARRGTAGPGATESLLRQTTTRHLVSVARAGRPWAHAQNARDTFSHKLLTAQWVTDEEALKLSSFVPGGDSYSAYRKRAISIGKNSQTNVLSGLAVGY